MNQKYLKMKHVLELLWVFLLHIFFYFNKNVEMFGNYKSSCTELPKAIQNALDERK